MSCRLILPAESSSLWPIPCYVTVTLYFEVLRDAIGDFAFIAPILLAVTLRFAPASYLQ